MDLNNASLEKAALKQTVMNVIEYGSVYNVEKLDELYADTMQIIRVGRDGKTNIIGKTDVLNFFSAKRAKKDAPLSKEAHFNHVEANNDHGHVIVTRVMKLFGDVPEKSVYSLCLTKLNGHWRVVKETVVSVA